MSKAEASNEKLPAEECIELHLAAAVNIKLEDCFDPTSLTEEQHAAWLAEKPRRPMNITRLDRGDRGRVLFESGEKPQPTSES